MVGLDATGHILVNLEWYLSRYKASICLCFFLKAKPRAKAVGPSIHSKLLAQSEQVLNQILVKEFERVWQTSTCQIQLIIYI